DGIVSNGDGIIQVADIRLKGPVTAGTDLARGKAATASSSEGGYAPSNAVDGDAATRWSSGQWMQGTGVGWVGVDLGAISSISRVRLNWEAAYAVDYQIQVSDDARNWTTLKAVTGNASKGVADATGLSGSGRYVRIYCTATNATGNYSLFEINV